MRDNADAIFLRDAGERRKIIKIVDINEIIQGRF